MERRDVLKSASTLAAASTVGLAGCGILGGGCDEPGDNFADSFPDSDDYERFGEGDIEAQDSEDEDVEQVAVAFYTDSNDDSYAFGISEFSSADTASSEADNVSSDANSDVEGEFGYIQTGPYVYYGIGPDEDSVIEFMSTSPTLGDCVEGNIEFA